MAHQAWFSGGMYEFPKGSLFKSQLLLSASARVLFPIILCGFLFIYTKAVLVKEQKHKMTLLGGYQLIGSMDLWVILRSRNQERK